uniref:Uncharacterized protein n=1 Tax=Utricularia reniformis TaxID=192314 RepID=A0A1Y0B3S1_9LAMI|nr:hypothetical protein AEK19_MT0835 [Utricularia reniformis]YP_009382302.1 hypothetical protein AEK19_MT1874 [Utricularia reniformis]ART31067.1 hypothetical protein AEK19_MT0835 [Utricularia reniformis]ART32044.1 hypothetical protein AEK19_MT1874 [Utricularia reniformis]
MRDGNYRGNKDSFDLGRPPRPGGHVNKIRSVKKAGNARQAKQLGRSVTHSCYGNS